MEQMPDKSPESRESVMELYTGREWITENRPRFPQLKKLESTMEMLNKTRTTVIILFTTFIYTSVYGYKKCNKIMNIDTIRIEYEHLDGYATYHSTVFYVLNNHEYILLPYNFSKTSNIPTKIGENAVCELLDNYVSYATDDYCKCLEITNEDYEHYLKIISSSDSLSNYLPLTCNFDIRKFKIDRAIISSLSCFEIIRLLKISSKLFHKLLPSLKIDLISANGEPFSIEPKEYFEGTTWKVLYHNKEAYLDYQYVMDFINKIGFTKYAFFLERFYFILHIVENLNDTGME